MDASVTLTEMLDGRMVCLYWYNAEWRTATKNTSDGSQNLLGVGVH
jgi:hypothetical protein